MNQQTSEVTGVTQTVAPMTLYQVESGGATYWVVAPTLRGAVDALFKCWDDEGSTDDIEHFTIDEMPSEKAKRIRFRAEPYQEPSCSMAEEAARQTGATVIACSEWP